MAELPLQTTLRDVDSLPSAAHDLELALDDRYDRRESLGVGGMGEVTLCLDERVGREVAIKVLRPEVASSPPARRRFLREARVQGQLEHPAIVPVHDIGLTPSGQDYFTMKRIRGFTLQEILIGIREGRGPWRERYGTRRLLAAFGQVCLAIDFAHARGIVHRDLKPANIMFGDFGEVYVLDWGLAKAMDEPPDGGDPTVEPLRLPEEPAVTRDGTVMGTLGYMAPEAMDGAPATLDPRSDVYALGAILFEILAQEPLHGSGSDAEIIASTAMGGDVAERLRALGRAIPPELEDVAARATARDPADRLPSARALHDALAVHLEGDLDLERRRSAARAHLARAEEIWAAATSRQDDEGTARAQAAREAGRALALDPDLEAALDLLLCTVLEPPRREPPDVRAQITATTTESVRAGSRGAQYAFLAWFVTLPIIFVMGVRWVWPVLASSIAMAAAAGLNAWASRQRTFSPRLETAVALTAAIGLFPAAFMLGPFLIVPGMACILATGLALKANRHMQTLGVGLAIFLVLTPLLLEWMGLLPPSFAFRDGTLVILPRGLDLTPVSTLLVLVFASVGAPILCAQIAAKVRNVLTRAEERVQLRAWQLQQVLPEPAERAVARTSSPPDEEPTRSCVLRRLSSRDADGPGGQAAPRSDDAANRPGISQPQLAQAPPRSPVRVAPSVRRETSDESQPGHQEVRSLARSGSSV